MSYRYTVLLLALYNVSSLQGLHIVSLLPYTVIMQCSNAKRNQTLLMTSLQAQRSIDLEPKQLPLLVTITIQDFLGKTIALEKRNSTLCNLQQNDTLVLLPSEKPALVCKLEHIKQQVV